MAQDLIDKARETAGAELLRRGAAGDTAEAAAEAREAEDVVRDILDRSGD